MQLFRRGPTPANGASGTPTPDRGPHRPPPAPPTAASHEPFPLAEGYYGTVRTSDGGLSQHQRIDGSFLDDGNVATGRDTLRRHGRGLMVYPDRTIYEGDWVDDERHGPGICLFPSGNVYIGDFHRGHMEGRGSMLYHDGDFFTGSFYKSTCHGVGAFYSGGTEVRGEWRNGVRVAVQRRKQTTFEDFDAQRLHYETFSAVLRQLHNHFSFYALFDNRFMTTIDGPMGNAAAGSPHIAEPTHPNRGEGSAIGAAAAAAAAGGGGGQSPGRHSKGGDRRITISPPDAAGDSGSDLVASFDAQRSKTHDGTHQPHDFSLLVPVDTNNSWDETRGAASSDDEDPPVCPPLAATTSRGAPRAVAHRQRASSPMNSSSVLLSPVAGAGANSKISFSTAPNKQQAAKHRGHRSSIDVTGSPSKFQVPSDASAAQPSSSLRDVYAPGSAATAAQSPALIASGYHGGTVGGVTQQPGTGVAPPNEATAYQQTPALAAPSQPIGPPPRTQSRCSLFPSAGPTVNEHFSMHEYMRHVVLFMFPLLSIPHMQSCPLTITGLEMEREFVVSGAALSHDFTPPKGTVYLAIVGLLVQVAAVVMASAETGVTSVMGHAVLSVEIVAPGVLWVVFAFTCAGYHGFFRVAHALERLDRRLAPKLAAFAASVVDASADICVFTWDEEGRSKITNAHYKYRWMCLSVMMGGCAAFAAPLTRVAYGIDGFLSDDGFKSAVVGLTVVAMFVFTSGLTYYILKVTDMQRQVRSQLKILTKLAHLDGVAITAPSEHRKIKFDLDGPLDVHEFFTGFVGWWITRSFVLGASACSNHLARSASMSAFVVAQTTLCVVVMGDAVFAGATGQLHRDDAGDRRYYTGAHSIALVFVAFGGFLMCRYLAACVSTRHEMKQHLNIMDVAALYHSAIRRDMEASHVIQLCRSMTHTHDPVPTVASIEITPFLVLLLSSINVLAFATLWVIFADAF